MGHWRGTGRGIKKSLLPCVAFSVLLCAAGCGGSGGDGGGASRETGGANVLGSTSPVGTTRIGTTGTPWLGTTRIGTTTSPPIGTTWIGTTRIGTTGIPWINTTWIGTTRIGTTTPPPIGTTRIGTTAPPPIGTTRIGTTWIGTTSPPRLGTTSALWPSSTPWPVQKAVGGQGHVAALLSDGRIVAAGSNSSGQLGIGTTTSWSSSWIQVGSDADWADVAAGEDYTIALKADGTLWGWGMNNYGQLALNPAVPRSGAGPAQGAGTGWASLSAGSHHAVGFLIDGSAWSWGYNAYGGLGVGSVAYWLYEPQSLGNGWSLLSAGLSGFGLGIRTDGTLWAWGYNYYGQCGFGNTFQSQWPVQVGADRDWAAVSAGTYHTLALKTDGSLWAWGYSAHGEIGNSPSPMLPTRIGSDNDWAAVYAGSSRSYALKADGSVWGWGLGLGAGGTNSAAPARISADDGFVGLVVRPCLMGLKADGTLVLL